MYKVCVIEDNPLIRQVLKAVLVHKDFEVSEFCEISERCPGFLASCPKNCPRSAPCRGMLILFNCERNSSGIEFLKFISRYQCPCVHSFKVLYTCEEISAETLGPIAHLQIQTVAKENPAIDMLPVIEHYKEWYRNVEAQP